MYHVPSNILSSENVEINLTVVQEICDNDPTLLKKLATTFIKTSYDNIQKLNEYIINEDPVQLKNTAHACRSSLSIFKCSDLYDLMLNIESITQQKENSSLIKEMIGIGTVKFQLMINLLIIEFELND